MARKPEITEAGRKAIAVAEGQRDEARKHLSECEKAYTKIICDVWGLDPGKRIIEDGIEYALAERPLRMDWAHQPPWVMAHKVLKSGALHKKEQTVYSGWEWAE